MTDEQINRTIAESLYPPKGDDVCIICGWALQGLEWYEHCGPPDFIKNPAMTLMLMEKLLENEIYEFEFNRDMICASLTEKGAAIYSSGFFIDWRGVMPFSECVALAYIRAHNLGE